MKISAIKTNLFEVHEDFTSFVLSHVSFLKEESVLAISSKLFSIAQNRFIPMPPTHEAFLQIVAHESGELLPKNPSILHEDEDRFPIVPTISQNNFFLNAGVDKSNTNGQLLLLPSLIFEPLEELWVALRKQHSLEKLGLLLIDSHCLPLRAGVVGTCLGWYGFNPLESLKGQKDLYGYPLRVTQVNVADSLAVSADYVMGQSHQSTPMALIEDAFPITFRQNPPSLKEKNEFFISRKKDLYGAIFNK